MVSKISTAVKMKTELRKPRSSLRKSVGVVGKNPAEIADVERHLTQAKVRLSFLVWLVYNILLSAVNLVKWGKSDEGLVSPVPRKANL